MHTSSTILLIAGSTRPTRRSPLIAGWVAELGAALGGPAFEVVDLAALGLGLDDEPGLPARDGYVHAATQRWSERVAASAGVVFVTPQYNWGYPAALKNAIDHLYREWRGKPAAIVSYGGHGGDKAAAGLRVVLEGLHMRQVSTMPALRLPRARIEANDGAVEPAIDFADQREEVVQALRELVGLLAEAPVRS